MTSPSLIRKDRPLQHVGDGSDHTEDARDAVDRGSAGDLGRHVASGLAGGHAVGAGGHAGGHHVTVVASGLAGGHHVTVVVGGLARGHHTAVTRVSHGHDLSGLGADGAVGDGRRARGDGVHLGGGLDAGHAASRDSGQLRSIAVLGRDGRAGDNVHGGRGGDAVGSSHRGVGGESHGWREEDMLVSKEFGAGYKERESVLGIFCCNLQAREAATKNFILAVLKS